MGSTPGGPGGGGGGPPRPGVGRAHRRLALVLAPGEALVLEELHRWAGDRLAPYKLPTRLLALEGLPRNAMGKVTRADLVRLFTDLHLRRHRQDRGRLQGRSDLARDAAGGPIPAKARARRALTRGRLEGIGVRFALGGAIICRDGVPERERPRLGRKRKPSRFLML